MNKKEIYIELLKQNFNNDRYSTLEEINGNIKHIENFLSNNLEMFMTKCILEATFNVN